MGASTQVPWTGKPNSEFVMSIPYRFPHFRRELLYHDVRFEGGPESGREFPDFDLPTIGGDRLTLDQATDERPMLMYFASFT